MLGTIKSLDAQITTAGKYFYFGFMQNAVGAGGAAPTLRVQITSKFNTTGNVSAPMNAFNQNFTVVPGAPTTITFPTAGYENATAGAPQPMGLFITANDPISVSAESVVDYSTDAARLFPLRALRDEYIVSTYSNVAINTWPEFLVVATADGTQVEITPANATLSGQPAGVPFTINLDEGQTYMVQSQDDLTGSRVISNDKCKPIAVFGGSSCSSVPNGPCCCDHLYEQMIPIVAWGKEYYTTGFRQQERLRVMAAQNNTTVRINGGAPFVLNAGQFNEFNAGPPTPYHIVADKPIALTEYAPSGALGGVGDPFQSRTFSIEQGIDTMVFSTIVGVNNNHRLSILTETATVPSVELDGASISAGFVPHPQNPDFSYLNYVLGVSGLATSYELTATGPMVAMIHGFGSDDSYAFSGGGFVNNLAIELDYPDTVCVDSTVQFDETISYAYLNLEYDFGDGTTSTSSDPTHIYTTPGNYTVTLEVEELLCLPVESLVVDIVVQAPVGEPEIIGESPLCPGIAGSFLGNIINGNGSSTVQYNWDWDGGNVISGADEGPYQVSWPDTGTYYVTLDLTDPASKCKAAPADTFVVVVKNPLQADAGPDFGVCQTNGSFNPNPTPNATGTWTPGPGMIVNSPGSPYSQFVLSQGPGSYYAIWSEDSLGCLSEDTVFITYTPLALPEAGPNQISCDGTGSVSATSNTGFGQWNEPTGSVSFTNPTLENSDYSGPPGNYLLYWCDQTASGCASCDSLNVIIYPEITAFAGNDTATCGEFIQLQGSTTPTTSGTYQTDRPNTNIFSGGNGQAFIQLNNLTPPFETVDFYYIETNGSCSDTDTVVVTFYDLPAPEAGPNDSVCGLNYTLDATPTAGSGKWTVLDPFGNSVSPVFNPHDSTHNPTVSINATYGEYTFYWNVDQGVCKSQDSVKIEFLEEPVANAGLDDTICALCYTLNPSTSVGSGVWSSNQMVSFNDSTLPNAQACVNAFGIYELYWEENNGGCISRDTVEINFFESASINISPDSSAFCGSNGQIQANMNKPNQSGYWTTNCADLTFANPNDSITNLTKTSSGCCWVYYNIDYGNCIVSDSAQVCFFDLPQTNAGQDDSICGTQTQLAAQPSLGQGQWSDISGLLSFNANDPNTNLDLNGAPYGNYCMVWTETNGACVNRDTVCIEFVQQPSAQAGIDTSICDTNLTLYASASVGQGVWTAIPTGPVFSDSTNPAATVNFAGSAYGSYDLIWTETNQICVSSDTLQVNFTQQPQAFAGLTDSVCGPSYVLQGAYSTPSSTGFWTTPVGVSVAGNDPNATASIPTGQYGTYSLIWTENNGGCSDSDTLNLTFIEQPNPNAGTDQSICDLNFNLQGVQSVSGSQIQWTSIQAGAVFGNANSVTSTVTVPNYGVYQFILTETNEVCSESDTVEISFEEQTNISPIPNDSICGSNLTLVFTHSANGSNFGLTSSSGAVNISSPNDSTFTISVANNYGCYSFTLTEDNQSCSDSETFTLCFYEPPLAFAGVDDEICGLTYTLNATSPTANGNWTGPAGVVFQNPNSNTTDVDVSALSFGAYEFVFTDSNAICLDRDTVEINFYDNPDIACNCDYDTIYTTDPFYQFIDSTQNAVTWTWNFGDGNTSNVQSPKHGYTQTGIYDVTLTVADKFGCTSTHTCKIELLENIRFFVPNAFTPDGDGVNDGFKPSILGHVPGSYKMEIYDRWGKRIFETDNENESWDGLSLIDRKRAKPDVYAVRIYYSTYSGTDESYEGMVVLVR